MKRIIVGDKHALVDDEDFELVSKHKWRLMKHSLSDSLFYAITKVCIGYTVISGRKYGGKDIIVSMHRLILDAKPAQMVDHVNRNGLDNRRSNLRFCSSRQNTANSKFNKNNTSGYKGVVKVRSLKNPWQARIGKSGERDYVIGHFSSPIEAAKAYNKEARKRYGEFAYENILA